MYLSGLPSAFLKFAVCQTGLSEWIIISAE